MEQQRRWFWRSIGVWFVSSQWGHAEWSKIARRSGLNRTARRRFVMIWLVLIIYDIWLSFHILHQGFGGSWVDVFAPGINMLAAILTLLILVMDFSRPSLQDRAFIEYGKGLLDLEKEQRAELMRKFLLGVTPLAQADEIKAAERSSARNLIWARISSVILLPLIAFDLFYSFRYGGLRPLLHARTAAGYIWRFTWLLLILQNVIGWILMIRNNRTHKAQDEHDMESRLHAESAAYRFLRGIFLLAVLGYMAFCLVVGRYRLSHDLFVEAALGFAWYAFLGSMLSKIIRMWSDPDQPGEPEILPTGPETA